MAAVTVHRWLREDSRFQAAYNAAQRDLQREVESRLFQLAQAACETVANALEHGDVRAALVVLKGVGVLGGTPPVIGGERLSKAHLCGSRVERRKHCLAKRADPAPDAILATA